MTATVVVTDNVGDGDWTVTAEKLAVCDLHRRSGHSPVCVSCGRHWPCPIATVTAAWRATNGPCTRAHVMEDGEIG